MLSAQPALPAATASEVLAQYEQLQPMRPSIDLALIALVIGFEAVNAYLRNERHEPPLFCAVETLAVEGKQLVDKLSSAVRRDPARGSISFESAMLLTLIEEFPCKQNSN